MEAASEVIEALQFCDLIACYFLWLLIRGDFVDEKSLVPTDRCDEGEGFMPGEGEDFALVARTAFIFTP